MWLDIMVPNWGGMLRGLMLGFSIYVAMNVAIMASCQGVWFGAVCSYPLGHGAPCLRAVSTGVDHIPLGTCPDAKHEYNFDGHGKRFRSRGS